MHKKWIIFGSLVVITWVLAGCFGSKSSQPKEAFSVEVCNDYIHYMQCMADSPEAGYTISDVEALVDARKDIKDTDMLESACGIAFAQAVKDMEHFENTCEVPDSLQAEDVSIEEEDNQEDIQESLEEEASLEDNEVSNNEPDQDIINAISGQTNSSSQDMDISNYGVEEAKNTQDDEIVWAVVKNILATTYP